MSVHTFTTLNSGTVEVSSTETHSMFSGFLRMGDDGSKTLQFSDAVATAATNLGMFSATLLASDTVYLNPRKVYQVGDRASGCAIHYKETYFIVTESASTISDRIAETINEQISSGYRNVITVSVNTTAKAGDVLLCDASSGELAITLPAPKKDAIIDIMKTDEGGNRIAISTTGGLIYGLTVQGESSINLTKQYVSVTLVSDGTNWYII